jgi:GAF domain-containing protein
MDDQATRMARVFVELADTLVENFDVVDFLQTLTDRCVELLGADASGLMLTDQRGGLQLMTATLERARMLELFELQVQEGPCLDCFNTGDPVTNVDLAQPEAGERWPVFTPAALGAGFGATHALPMRLRGRVIGALNMFNDRSVQLSDSDLAVGQAMADVATIGLLHQRNTHEQTILSEQLQTALQSRILIEQAKGALAARTGLSVNEAFHKLRNHARRNNLTLTDVATAVIDQTTPTESLLTV